MSVGGWNSGPDREAMLRRVAIVLSSLPSSMAAQLLQAIGPDTEQAVRRTMTTLSDVDPLERQRAIQAFKITLQRESVPTDDSQADLLQLGASGPSANKPTAKRVVPSSQASVVDRDSQPASPLTFLGDVDATVLARLLEAEHPQTIAFVLASISPAQAATVLPQLGPKLQCETMNRIGRLGEIPETAVAEVAEHFRIRLQDQQSSHRHSLGQKALNAILAAMPPQSGAAQGPPADAHHEGFADRFSGRHGTVSTHQDQASGASAAAGAPAQALTQRLKVAEGTWPQAESAHHPRRDASAGRQTHVAGSQPPAQPHDHARPHDRVPTHEHAPAHDHAMVSRAPGQPSDTLTPARTKPRPGSSADDLSAVHPALTSTDNIHRHLIGLRPVELCRALGQVETRDAMLALCGLPVQVANAALAVLPRAQAKTVRNKMNALGSLNLREIDRAKEKVAVASLGALPSPALSSAAA